MPGRSLFATSDLHVSHQGNRPVAEQIRPTSDGDWLIVAGDVAETVADVEWTLRLLRDRFERVIWVPGNHELWTTNHDEVQLRGQARYEHYVNLCRKLDVVSPEDPYPVWEGDTGQQLVIAPLFLLYDYTFRAPGQSMEQALEQAYDNGVVFSDEALLHPDPYPSRQAWCHQRVAETLPRLEAIPETQKTVLVSHWPLHRGPTRMLRLPDIALWCGTELTADWHTRFRAEVAVYGHLHIPISSSYDGVRFEEVSLGYPREWRRRTDTPQPLRRIA